MIYERCQVLLSISEVLNVSLCSVRSANFCLLWKRTLLLRSFVDSFLKGHARDPTFTKGHLQLLEDSILWTISLSVLDKLNDYETKKQ